MNLDIMDVKTAEEGEVDAKKTGAVQHIKSSAAIKGGDAIVSNKIASAPSNSSTANRVATVNPAPVVPVNSISLEKKAPLAILGSSSSLLSKDGTQPPMNIVLNVGGQKFESLVKNFLTNFPNSRLWQLGHAIESDASSDEILQICDRFKRERPGGGDDGLDYDYIPAEYFFDKNWTGFAAILDAYRTGHLHLNSNICAVMTREDMAYWGMDELTVEPCCAVKFYPEIEICVKEIEMEETEKQRELERERLEDFGPSFIGRTRKILWNLFEYPATSRAAQFNACFSLSMVVISTACFVLSCVYEQETVFTAVGDSTLIDERTPVTAWSTTDEGNKTAQTVQDNNLQIIQAIVWVDAFTAVYFTIEYVVRFSCAPQKLRFFVSPMNIVDLLAILPYFVSMLLDHLSEFHIIGKTGKVLRLIRVTRILRVFKLVRHFAGLQSLFSTLVAASRELGLLAMLIGVTVLTLSSLVYFAEKDGQDWSFMDSFWWGLLTITTVGWGTTTPMSGMGKLIGSMCALLGVFTITMPVPIMVNNFTKFYKNKLWRGEVALQRRERQLQGLPTSNPKKYSTVLATSAKGNKKEKDKEAKSQPLLNQIELNGVQ